MTDMQTQPAKTPKPKSSWLNLVVDYGPLLVFFLAYKHFMPKDAADSGVGAVVAVTKSTMVFMVATVIALVVSKWRLGKISPMLWLSSALILGFGTLTVLSGDPRWIEHKPTAVYLLFAMGLFVGVLKNKPVMKYLLESAFDGLSDNGWAKLSRNWAFFFVFLALLNEGLLIYLEMKNPSAPFAPAQNPSIMGEWLKIKVYLFTPLSFLFTFAQIPMLMRHGLGDEATVEVEQNPPHD
jgi:intracellular septation protein